MNISRTITHWDSGMGFVYTTIGDYFIRYIKGGLGINSNDVRT